ncbi:MAG: tetratricopeptide repeat protein [Planctomycetaceae bacterium]|jgi:tetratricopeptide (TPR) repeat protein|nr:tetratricopeptide repeat protein [Planctomycetaceae bacterium]
MTHDEKLKTAQTALISGDTARAEELYQDILRGDSGNLYALDGLGVLRCQNGNPTEGIEFFLEALHQFETPQQPEISNIKNSDTVNHNTVNPNTVNSQAVLLFHLGLAYRILGHNHDALNVFCKSRQLDPNNPDLILNLGQLYFELDQPEEAISCFKNMTVLQPENASAWLTLGYLYTLRNHHTEAIPVLSEAVRLDPSSPEACFFLAESLRKEERFEESIPYYQRLFPVGMEWSHAVHGCGQSLLALGDFENGWDAMEFRLVNAFGTWERHLLPNWNGNSANNRIGENCINKYNLKDKLKDNIENNIENNNDNEQKTVLAYSEEGIAADIMFASCLPDLINSVGHCVIECESSLHSLFRRSFPRATVVPLTPDTVDVNKNSWGISLDEQIALGSLPRYFRRRKEDFPIRKAYLVPDRERVTKWSNRLLEIGGVVKIGVLWQGSWTAEPEHQTALPMFELRNLMLRHQSDAAWICLQHGSKQKEIEQYRRNVSLQIHLYQEVFQYDLDEMAALLTTLDLVVTPSGYVANLAGALGAKTWLILPAKADWRWNLSRENCLWYPTFRVYRQAIGQSWSELFATVGTDLEKFLTTHHPPEESIPATLAFPEQNKQTLRFRRAG